MNARIAIAAAVAWAVAGCSVHPDGEARERDRAAAAGRGFAAPFAERDLPPLRADSPLATWIAHAEQANGGLEAAWHRWQAALEEVPQAGTQDSTAMLGLEHRLDGGSALDRTGLMLMSDTMANVLVPGRLGARAEAALARARVAAAEFGRARLGVQREVAAAYWALALRDEEIRLLTALQAARSVQVASVRGALAGGRATQADLLAAEVALLRLDAELAGLHADRPGLAAALAALAGAGGEAAAVAPALAEFIALADGEERWLAAALARNPGLEAARAEHAAALAEVAEREWRRVPEFSLRGLLMGDGAATLAGAVTLPFLRGSAIEAAVRQAEAAVRAAEAVRRQAGRDATAAVVGETAALRAIAAERDLLRDAVLPRLQQAVAVARSAWSTGRGGTDGWVEAEAMRIEVARAVARLDAAGLTARARLAEAAGGL
ncbi:MAG: TolC family protein [Planctomycetes bacterium]|nr:TolC family protein [Planctomycetota bacterium]